MSQITVWKCDQTGKLFEDKAKYQSHLRKLARERNTKRKLTVIEAEADAWWQAAYNKEMTIDQWRQFARWSFCAKLRRATRNRDSLFRPRFAPCGQTPG